MRTAILTFEQWQGKKGMGSSRIRGHWIIKHWMNSGDDIGTCELFKMGAEYDCVIYQKSYFVEHAKHFKGLKIFDLCDPDWMHWGYRLKEMLEEVDAVTTSSVEIAKFIQKMTTKPVWVIFDRIDLDLIPEKKEHTGSAEKVLWYGYSDNFPMVSSAAPAINKLGLELIVLSNEVFLPPAGLNLKLTNLPWSEHYLRDIQKADIVINPRLKRGKWKYKSDNKTTLAWALGIPVAHNEEELKKLVGFTPSEREAESKIVRDKAFKYFDVKESVLQFKELIVELQHGKRKAQNENI